MSFETKESLASELVTFVDNDGVLNQGQTLSIIKNLVKKMASGKYDPEKAVKLFMYLAESGARKYAKVFSGDESGWHDMFPVDVRKLAATHWRDSFEAEAKLGNYDEYVPKKYQKTASKNPAKKTSRSKTLTLSSEGADLAQRVATNLSETEIASIVEQQHIYGTGNTKLSAVAARGYLSRMRAILDAMRGN